MGAIILSMSMGMKLCAKFGRSRSPRMAVGGGVREGQNLPQKSRQGPRKWTRVNQGQLGQGHLGSSSP